MNHVAAYMIRRVVVKSNPAKNTVT